MKWKFGEYTFDTDKSIIPIDRVKEFLSKSYWAADRTVEQIEKSVEGSFCYGVYHGKELVGFARVVSDYATMFYVCDVYIHESHRKNGLGKKLIKCILETEEFKNIKGILATNDAHGLYERFGFKRVNSRYMARTPQI
ncbi:GNAT family N-acetyltransferase [Desulfitobacterium sp. Sab5]|uniref:GNAT family N-acetyltransferase n=1 Tax=Desulfitobacterium nosdiversum TaxID=3375356 RepID=UPI003CE80659